MTILFYIVVAMFSAVMLAGAVVAVFKLGEKENICDYGEDKNQ